MPVRAVTTRFMYKGLCTIPDVLAYRAPVSLPEDEVEGECCGVVLVIVKSFFACGRHAAKAVQHLGELLAARAHLTVRLLV